MFYGSIPALITPFDNNHKIDYDSLENLLYFHLENNSDALVLGGTTGEAPTLTNQEIFTLLTFCREKLKSKIPLIIGTGSNCTRKTIEMTKKAKDLGADGALIIVPYYNKPTDHGCLMHFEAISKLNLPIIAYHHPGRTGKTLSIDSLVTLSKMTNIVGIKEASGTINTSKSLLKRNPEAKIFSGDDPLTIDLIELGAIASISIIANLLPKNWHQIVHAALSKNIDHARTMYQEIEDTIKSVLSSPNPIGIKSLMSQHSLCQNFLRCPMMPLNIKEPIKI